MPYHGQATSSRYDGGSCADVECLQEVPARAAVVDQGLKSVQLDLDGVVFVERLEGTCDFLRFWFRFESAMKAPCCKSGCSVRISAASSLGLGRNAAPNQVGDDSAETRRLCSSPPSPIPCLRPAPPPETLQSRLCSRDRTSFMVRYRTPAAVSEVRARSHRPVVHKPRRDPEDNGLVADPFRVRRREQAPAQSMPRPRRTGGARL